VISIVSRTFLTTGRTTAGVAATGLLLAGCGFAGMSDLPLPGNPDVGDAPIVVTAQFADVLSLARDATVKYDGVTVGRVERIGRNGWDAVATLKLRGDLDIPSDATARIAQTSLLGEKYVQLAAPIGGGTGRLADGTQIGRDRTSRGREVEEVLGSLALLLNGGGLAQLHTVAAELDTALGNDDTARTFLRELDEFVGTLDRNQGTIIEALENVNRLSRQIADDRETVDDALDDITPAVESLADQRHEIVSMLEHLDRFSLSTSRVVRESGAELAADLAALKPVLAQLAKAGDDLPRVLETVLSFPFPDEVLQAVKGDYVNLDVLVDLTPANLLGNFGNTGDPLTAKPAAVKAGSAAKAPKTTAPTMGKPPAELPVKPLADMLGKLLGNVLKGGS
jgi:phospholipid/cholesterol/gamma-HCH transport system substrate-binding protein